MFEDLSLKDHRRQSQFSCGLNKDVWRYDAITMTLAEVQPYWMHRSGVPVRQWLTNNASTSMCLIKHVTWWAKRPIMSFSMVQTPCNSSSGYLMYVSFTWEYWNDNIKSIDGLKSQSWTVDFTKPTLNWVKHISVNISQGMCITLKVQKMPKTSAM